MKLSLVLLFTLLFILSVSGQGTEPVFPATSIRFYPGFYFSVNGNSLYSVNREWTENIEPYRDQWQTTGTFLGVFFTLPWNSFYKDTNIRPADPADPDDPAYSWSNIDNLLTGCTFLNNGHGKIAFRLDDRRGENNPPLWVRNTPYNGAYYAANKNFWVTVYHRQSAVTELAAFLTALGKRYGEDKRIAFIALEETVLFGEYPDDYNNPLGGGSGGFTGLAAWSDGVVQRDIALAKAAPGMTVIDYGLHSSYHAPTLPYKIGSGHPDPYLFAGTCGDFGYPNVDCPSNARHWTGQNYRDQIPTLISSEFAGWSSENWPAITTPWGNPGTSGIDPERFLWYFSGPPKARAPKNDSSLGQNGPDPAGPIPASIIVVHVRNDQINRTLPEWKKALDTFGPSGTFAAPYFPAGYNVPLGYDEKIEKVLNIYPTVTDGIVYIEGEINVKKILLLDFFGRRIEEYGNVAEINTSSFTPGFYLLKIFTSDGPVLSWKILKI